ncbi:NAD-dependent epimerase/dehydratase family protein [Candidatus Pacearchaeota archaeon]|nr:NAD-dependent epimerase/dehydratase family protein [Candidatus Pacearchaeota archaeon]
MKWSNKRVLITGGAGFIGSHLARRLLRDDAKVVILDNFSAGKKRKIPLGCDVIEGDVRDSNMINTIDHVDYIFNFGSPSSVILYNQEPNACIESTVCGFINILQWAIKVGVKKVVYPSSGSVYGATPPPQSENDNVFPMNLYGISKLSCEHVARIYSDRISTVGLRIFAGYGPGEEHKGSFASPVTIFLSSIMNDERPIVYGNGTQSRDFIYIDDIVESIIRSVEKDVLGVINVGVGKSHNFNEVIEYINTLLNKDIRPIYIDKPVNYLEITLADIKKMKRLLDINPSSLEKGLQKYLDYI